MAGKARQRGRVCALLVLGVVAVVLPALAQDGSSTYSSYDIRAAMLYNFARFVAWPEGRYATANTPISLCVLGPDPFGRSLEVIEGKRAQGRAMVVSRIDSWDQVDDCHMLYVGASRAGQEEEIAAVRGTLTVADAPGFAEHGGMIRFVERRNRISLLVNIDQARKAGLKISAKLLQVATIVTTPRGDG